MPMLFLNPILEAEQASISPLGGDLGLMRLTLDKRCAWLEPDYMQDQHSAAAEEHRGHKNWRIAFTRIDVYGWGGVSGLHLEV